MKKKNERILQIDTLATIDSTLLASTAIELLRLLPQADTERAIQNEEFRPFVSKAFKLLRVTHEYLEDILEGRANEPKKKA